MNTYVLWFDMIFKIYIYIYMYIYSIYIYIYVWIYISTITFIYIYHTTYVQYNTINIYIYTIYNIDHSLVNYPRPGTVSMSDGNNLMVSINPQKITKKNGYIDVHIYIYTYIHTIHSCIWKDSYTDIYIYTHVYTLYIYTFMYMERLIYWYPMSNGNISHILRSWLILVWVIYE